MLKHVWMIKLVNFWGFLRWGIETSYLCISTFWKVSIHWLKCCDTLKLEIKIFKQERHVSVHLLMYLYESSNVLIHWSPELNYLNFWFLYWNNGPMYRHLILCSCILDPRILFQSSFKFIFHSRHSINVRNNLRKYYI